jgi:hypothetical protein
VTVPGFGGLGIGTPIVGPVGGPIAGIPIAGCAVPLGPCGCCPGVCIQPFDPVLAAWFTDLSFCYRW